MNPDYQKEQEEKAKKWEEDQRPKNEQCLRLMRTLVPPDIAQCNLESLSSRMPKALAQRMWSKKALRSEEHTSELQSLMRISYAVFCLKKKTKNTANNKS